MDLPLTRATRPSRSPIEGELMPNAPRVWLQYRPIRIGWVISEPNIARLITAASWSACLWGGRFNPIIPIHDSALAERLLKTFGVDLLIPIDPSDSTRAFMDRFAHLEHHRWRDSIFERRRCEFADIRHIVRRIHRNQDHQAKSALILPTWDRTDELDPLFSLSFGRHPPPDDQIADYKGGIRRAFDTTETSISGAVPRS
jgi:hypothetical protein